MKIFNKIKKVILKNYLGEGGDVDLVHVEHDVQDIITIFKEYCLPGVIEKVKLDDPYAQGWTDGQRKLLEQINKCL